MAFWPFGRRKKKAEKLQEKEADGSTARQATKNSPDLYPPPPVKSKQRNRQKTLRKETKPLRTLPHPPETKPPIPEKSALRPQVSPPPHELVSTDPFDEKVAAVQEQRERAGPSRAPLAKPQIPETAPPPAIFEHANSASQTSLQPEHNFTVMRLNAEVPTLRPKQDGKTSDAARRKSSKRKSESRDREQAIKAMTSPIPIPKRPQTFSSSPLARDTKRVPGGLNRHFERPNSEVSLPVPAPDSVRSSMSAGSEWQHSYKVGAMDALSPRPTIKYAESPRLGSRENRASRASVRKEKAPAIPEEPFSLTARMDDLADDLDAKAIRELMERDRRRRERKKKKADCEKLQRKSQRRAERQKAAGAQSAAGNQQNNVDTEMEDASSANATPGQHRVPGESSAAAAEREAAQPSSPWLQAPSGERSPSPSADPFKDSAGEAHLGPGPDSEQASMKDEPIIETAKAVRLSSASMSPPLSPVQRQPRGPSGLSNLVSSPTSQEVTELPPLPEPQCLRPPEAPRRDSESSGRAGGSSWTSFFRRRGTKAQRKSPDRDRHAPSEFSNTSRESFARFGQSPPGAAIVQRSFRKGPLPQRTQSKFREDLPDFPISPPRSRIQSPEVGQPASPSSPYIDDQTKLENLDEEARVSTPIEDVHPAFREQVSLNQSMRTPSPEGPTSALLSQSLASIDSEGSWLSGRQPKRSSIPISSVRASQASTSQDLNEEKGEAAAEPSFARREVGMGAVSGPGGLSAQLRYLRTSSVGDGEDYREMHAENEDDDGSIKYNTVKGRTPNIVQRSPYAKSREVLIGEFANAEEDSPVSPASPDTPETPEREPTVIHRATSVDYGGRGHVRQLSAGSARLLNIPARSSAEAARSITDSDKARSPLSEAFPEETEEPAASSSEAYHIE
ncbi:MAG: hypothetical protein LQ340_006958 [Diploschistes diacapsis]|nr:MAG: hypothetical protein LQ340_006958 [Diploschistes diacapsis]